MRLKFQNITKKYIRFPLEKEKIRPSRHLLQLSIWMSELGILNIETQLNSLKIDWIQRLDSKVRFKGFNLTNALLLYQLNLILNYNQGLALYRQKQMLRSTSHKDLQKQNNEVSLFNYSMFGYILPITISLPPRL